MKQPARIYIHPNFIIGDISPRLYGAFLEPIGTMVNGSMYNPKHPTADQNGFRRDWIEALKATGLPAVRLPGGNFVSGWDWKQSIGPREQRKAQLDTAWTQYYTNEVGHALEYYIYHSGYGPTVVTLEKYLCTHFAALLDPKTLATRGRSMAQLERTQPFVTKPPATPGTGA